MKKKNILEICLTSLISAIYSSIWSTSSAQVHVQSSKQINISKMKFRETNRHAHPEKCCFFLLTAAAVDQWTQAEVNTAGSDW